MHWYDYLSYFFGGAFLGNTIPHLVNGISGRSFQSPFANPPGKGVSSPTVNVIWGLFNLAVAYVLIVEVGSFDLHNLGHIGALFAGMLFISINMARHFGQFHSGL